jgi:hypothetical protein
MKTKTTHTPGPWTNERTKATTAALGKAFGAAIEEGDIEIWAGPSCIALARHPRDARLISAAPEFREAAERALDNSIDQIEAIDEAYPDPAEVPIWAQSVRDSAVRIRDDARAAITKSEGQ